MGKTKFDVNWLLQKDVHGQTFGEYITYDDKNINTISEVYCRLCNRKKITFDNRGITALKDHANSGKHRSMAQIRTASNQLRLVPSTTPPSTIAPSKPSDNLGEASSSDVKSSNSIRLHVLNENILEKEILWTMHVVTKNVAFNAAESDGSVLKMITPNDLQGFSLTRQKMTHLVNEAIGPFFKELFLDDIKGQYYSIMFDEYEATNKQKELVILVKYYSKKLRKIIIFHLESVFIGKATADVLLEQILKALTDNHISTDRLVMAGHGGPNVNKSLSRKFNNQLIGDRGFGMINNGTCVVHIIHNAFRAAIKKYGYVVSDLAKYLYYYFDVPSKWEEFIESCATKPKHFQKHVETRWATFGPAAEVIYSNYSHLGPLKRKLQGLKKRSFYEEEILKILLLSDIKEQVLFVIESAGETEKFIKFLETNEFILFDVYDRIHTFLVTMMSRVYCPDKITEAIRHKKLKEENFLKDSEVIIFKSILDEAGNQFKPFQFKKHVRDYTEAFVSYLFSKDVPNDFVRLVSNFKVRRIINQDSMKEIIQLVEAIDFKLDKSKIHEELVLASVKLTGKTFNSENDFEIMESLFQDESFSELNTLFNIVTCVSHSNAEVERKFSLSKHLMPVNRTRLSELHFNNRKNILSGMSFFENDVTKFVVSKDLILKAKFARQSYEAKQEQKKEDEIVEAQKKKEKERKNARHEIKKQEEEIGKKRKAKDDIFSLMENEIRKMKSNNPETSFLKVLLKQKDNIEQEEKSEREKLEKMKAKEQN